MSGSMIAGTLAATAPATRRIITSIRDLFTRCGSR